MHSGSELLGAAAAPAIPAGLAALGLVVTALGFAVLYSVLFAYRRSLGKFLLYIADQLDKLSILGKHLLGPISSALRTVHKGIDTGLADAALACESAMTWCAHSVLWLIRMMAREIADLAEAQVDAALWLKNRVIPRAIKQAAAVPSTAVKKLRTQVATLDRELDKAFGKARAGIDAINKWRATTLPRTLRGIRADIANLGKTIASPKWWRKHWDTVIPSAVASGIFVAALSRLGLRWLRCSNVKRAGKGVCNMDTNILEDLLLGVTTLTIALNLRAFAEEMGEVAEDTATFIYDRVK